MNLGKEMAKGIAAEPVELDDVLTQDDVAWIAAAPSLSTEVGSEPVG